MPLRCADSDAALSRRLETPLAVARRYPPRTLCLGVKPHASISIPILRYRNQGRRSQRLSRSQQLGRRAQSRRAGHYATISITACRIQPREHLRCARHEDRRQVSTCLHALAEKPAKIDPRVECDQTFAISQTRYPRWPNMKSPPGKHHISGFAPPERPHPAKLTLVILAPKRRGRHGLSRGNRAR